MPFAKPFPVDVPLLTNMPASAEEMAGQGGDVYFLSDRPETERYLSRTPERIPTGQPPALTEEMMTGPGVARPFKGILRDIPERRPAPEALSAMEAWPEFVKNFYEPRMGFNPDTLNPEEEAGKKVTEFYRSKYGGRPKSELDLLPYNEVKAIDDQAEKIRKHELNKYNKILETGRIDKAQFYRDFAHRETQAATERRHRETLTKPVHKAMSPIDLQNAFIDLPPEEAARASDALNRGDYNGYAKIVSGKKPRKEEPGEKLRDRALRAAQRDSNWPYADDDEQERIIGKYEAILSKGEIPKPPEEILGARDLPIGTKIDTNNRKHMAVIKRYRNEAMAKAKDPRNKEEARKIFNEIIKKKGLIR